MMDNIWVKRDDENGFLGGSKRRKYASLLPWLEQEGYRQVALTGGSNSNHVPACLSLLRERGIGASLFLKLSRKESANGNLLLTRLLATGAAIHWIHAADWPHAEEMAAEWAAMQSPPAYAIPEGGSCAPAIPGALSLAYDICRNEAALGFQFDHIWVDSGTGFMASLLAIGLAGVGHPATLHVVLLAGDQDEFRQRLQHWRETAAAQYGLLLSEEPRYELHKPASASAFGSVNNTVRKELRRTTAISGILCDPVYTAKLFMTLRDNFHRYQGRQLVIHGGGTSGLMGWGDFLLEA